MSYQATTTVVECSKSTGSARLVLFVIANHDGDGGAWPTIATLCREANMSEPTVHRAITRLQEIGEVRVHPNDGGTANCRGDRRPNRYEILLSRGITGDTSLGSRGITGDSHGVSLVTPKESLKNPSSCSSFDQFWDLYPRKTGKGRAREEYAKALKKADPARILQRLEAFAAERAGKDQQFTCHPATWLHQERWDDEPERGNGLKHSTRTVTRQRPGPNGTWVSFETTEQYIAFGDRPPKPSPNAVWYEADEAWTEYV